MDTASLKEFLALAETQNFWEASELLFMNESTLSKHIKKLESKRMDSIFDLVAQHMAISLLTNRHFYASGLIAAGCDVVTVQRALGHAKATTTLNTYSHLWPTAEDRTRGAAAGILAAVLAAADSVRTAEPVTAP